MENEIKPKVSVCVVCYNQERYIAQCLQSLVDQETNFPFEIIVSDDASTDKTPQIIQEFASKYPLIVRPVFHKKNIGAYENFKFIHTLPKAEYISHMDGDDYSLPGKLQKQASFLDENEDCAVVWHAMEYVQNRVIKIPASFNPYLIGKRITIEKAILQGSIAANSSTMYRKKHLPTVNFEFSFLDFFFHWQLLLSGWGWIIKDTLGGYTIDSPHSISKRNYLLVRKIGASNLEHYIKYKSLRPFILVRAAINMLKDLLRLKKSFTYYLPVIAKSFHPRGFVVFLQLIIERIISKK